VDKNLGEDHFKLYGNLANSGEHYSAVRTVRCNCFSPDGAPRVAATRLEKFEL